MAVDAAPHLPDVSSREDGARLALAGDWTLGASRRLEERRSRSSSWAAK
jgi:hypothetical protein